MALDCLAPVFHLVILNYGSFSDRHRGCILHNPNDMIHNKIHDGKKASPVWICVRKAFQNLLKPDKNGYKLSSLVTSVETASAVFVGPSFRKMTIIGELASIHA